MKVSDGELALAKTRRLDRSVEELKAEIQHLLTRVQLQDAALNELRGQIAAEGVASVFAVGASLLKGGSNSRADEDEDEDGDTDVEYDENGYPLDEKPRVAKHEPAPTSSVDEYAASVQAAAARDWPHLAAAIEARAKEGRAKYGTFLAPHNGRDVTLDALQEALDLVVYIKQAVLEGKQYNALYSTAAALAEQLLDLHAGRTGEPPTFFALSPAQAATVLRALCESEDDSDTLLSLYYAIDAWYWSRKRSGGSR